MEAFMPKYVSVEDSFILILTFTFQPVFAFIISTWQLQKYKLMMQRCITVIEDDPCYNSGWSYQIQSWAAQM